MLQPLGSNDVCYIYQSTPSLQVGSDVENKSVKLPMSKIVACVYLQLVTSGGGKLSLIKRDVCLATRR